MFKGNKYKIHISILICLARPGKYSFYMEDKKKNGNIYIYPLHNWTLFRKKFVTNQTLFKHSDVHVTTFILV